MCARAALAFELNPPPTNQQQKAESVSLVVTHSKWTGSDSIPPTSHPLAAHFPLQSRFIYWANWHPCHPQKTLQRLQASTTVARHAIHPTPGPVCVNGSSRERERNSCTCGCEGFGILTWEWRRRMCLRDTFCLGTLQNQAVSQTIRRSATEAQWLCSLTSRPLDTQATSHLSCGLCRTSSWRHCVFNLEPEKSIKC